MKDLNSIVITGKASVDWNKYMSMFYVQNKYKQGNVQTFMVLLQGERLIKICREGIKTGMQVRVVGSYETDHILADHVEVVE